MEITIIGNGNMAQAIISGLVKSSHQIQVVGRSLEKLEALKKQIPQITICELDKAYDITNQNIIFCVKPYNLTEVGAKLTGTANTLYSVLAGTTIQSLSQNISSKSYVRAMPNVSAKFCKSMTTLTGDENIKKEAIDIFNCIGQTLWVDTQNELDIATAVAGSGPAFLAHVADGIIEGAINAGLKKEDAITLTTALFDGFTPLLEDDEPKDIIKKVMSPNGTTQAGYDYLVKNKVKDKISQTIQTAYDRALELAKS
ncbi:MAG: pyrroline-5-carboxylate reductase [Arcobacteraceae bacterium]|nr:pyrroline-5-carboxylate reductase [Arcobacteraceae bacterium]